MSKETMSGKREPWSRDAEQGLLAAILAPEPREIPAEPMVAWCEAHGLREESFFDAKHQLLWRTVLGMHKRNEAIDSIAVAAVLESLEEFENFGGWTELNAITDRVLTEKNWKAHAKLVLDRAAQREYLAKARHAARLAEEPAETFDEMKDRGLETLTALGNLSLSEAGETLADVAARMDEEAQELAATGNWPKSVRTWTADTPWPWFHEYFGFYNPRDKGYNIVAGRPGSGKSAFMRNVMGHVLLQQEGTVVGFLLEMTREQWLRQMAAEVAQLDLKQADKEPHDKLQAYRGAMAKLREVADKRLLLFDADMTLDAIEARLRMIKTNHGGAHLVVVDYLQLIEAETDRWAPRAEAVGTISRRLRRLQKDLNSVFLVGSQINRESEKDNREPRLSDLRESGAVEQDAESVLILHKPKLDHLGAAQTDLRKQIEIHMIKAKNRFGPKGTIRSYFRLTTTTFVEFPGSKKVSPKTEERRTKKSAEG